MKRYLPYFIVFIFTAIRCSATDIPFNDSLRILFVGNSLTYTNDLPGFVKEIAIFDHKKIFVQSIALPDYSLEDHWKDGRVEDEILDNNYDFVVMQQGPSALPESRLLLKEFAGKFAEICQKKGSKMVLLMVWPSKARFNDFNGVDTSYSVTAKELGIACAVAGRSWRNLWKINSKILLYGPDGFHPGIDGTVLTALTLYITLTGKTNLNFIDYSKCSWHELINIDTDQLIKRVAVDTIF